MNRWFRPLVALASGGGAGSALAVAATSQALPRAQPAGARFK
ncbi:hypothetical protein PE066_00275 [Ramlibacter tataouinensis]|nr:hypothetical protein [Ramlibacter tataouinensis]WBY02011.1 hypothetical protein PE066_00275 [Ramlibacter tataouinensis]